MSKVFSLAGLRLGWIASHDTALRQSLASHRDYNLVSCGMLDEFIAAIALQHKDVLLERNRHIVQDNLHILDAWVQQEPHVWYVKPQAGTTALLHYTYDVPSYTLCRDMYKKTGVFAVPGDCFEVPQSMRIGYACDKNVLQQGLQYMSKFLSTLSV